MSEYITWERVNKKTVDAFNDQDQRLGFLQYEQVGRHWHWCWYQMPKIRMSPGCLEEVRRKQKALWNEQA